MFIGKMGRALIAAIGLFAFVLWTGVVSQSPGAVEAANNFGNPVNVNYTTYDIATDILIVDLNEDAPHAGTIDAFRIRRQAGGAGQSLRFVIVDSTLKVKWVSAAFIVPPGGDNDVRFAIPGGVAVAAGDYIGMYFPGAGAVPFDSVLGAAARFTTSPLGGVPAVGFDLTTSENAASPDGRVYGIRAIYGCGMTCYVNPVTGNDNNHGTSPADAFATIATAVSAVQTGGTIIAAAGTYFENSIFIDRAMTIKGANAGKAGNDPTRGAESYIDAEETGDGFHIEYANNVTIDGFTVANTWPGFHGNGEGIDAHDSTNVTVINNILFDIYGNAIDFDDAHDAFGVNTGTIARNLIYDDDADSGVGIQIEESTNIIVSDNVLRDLEWTYLLEVNRSAGVQVLRNWFYDLQCDLTTTIVYFQDSSNLLFAENLIDSQDCGEGDGVTLYNIDNATIRNNIISVWADAVEIDEQGTDPSNNVVVTLNDFSGSGWGLYIDEFGYTGALNAEKNWWGSNTGPSDDGPGSGVGLDDINGHADFDPWLCSGEDTSTAIGFQPKSTIALAHYSPCDTTPPEWTRTFRVHGGAAGSYNANNHPWSNKIVYMDFQCTDVGPNQSGIAQKQGDLSVTFKDGVYLNAGDIPWDEGTRKGDVPGEYCIDKAGNIADDINPLGGGREVWVDTKAPICKPAPTTTYIAKNSVNVDVQVYVDGSDNLSGVNSYGFLSIAAAGGASYDFTDYGFNGLFLIEGINMPNSTAGKVTVTGLTLYDAAGNSAKCATFYVKAK